MEEQNQGKLLGVIRKLSNLAVGKSVSISDKSPEPNVSLGSQEKSIVRALIED